MNSAVLIACLAVLQYADALRVIHKANSRLNFFDTDLLRYTAEGKKGNILISPASVKSVLMMFLDGAAGDTSSEIRSALRLTPNREEYREQIIYYLSALTKKSPPTVLENANAMFISNALDVKPEYMQLLKHVYMSDLMKVDVTNPALAANTINRWVDAKTRGLIPTIINPIQIDPSGHIMVCNALYFKSVWKYAFNPNITTQGCFRGSGNCITSNFMELQADLKYNYIEDLRAHAVVLPYQGDEHSMLLLVPHDRDGAAALIRDLPFVSVPQILAQLEVMDIQLSLPRFSVDYSDDLISTLKNMKINTLFSQHSNLSGMFENNQSAQVNNMFHRTHIDVNEVGTVAAAATAAMIVPLINSRVLLKVDRPFVFLILDNSLGATLFTGRIEDPGKV